MPSLGRSKNKNEEVLRPSISLACNGDKPDQVILLFAKLYLYSFISAVLASCVFITMWGKGQGGGGGGVREMCQIMAKLFPLKLYQNIYKGTFS